MNVSSHKEPGNAVVGAEDEVQVVKCIPEDSLLSGGAAKCQVV